MAVGAFPLVKLGALAIRQIAKPIANMIKVRAKSNEIFRNYVCMPPAQMYHYFEVNVKMRLLGLEKPSNVKKLNEAAAIELGAELLGESIIFIVAVATLAGEYYRQAKKSEVEAAALEERWTSVEKKVEELEFLTEKQRTEIRELSRLVYSLPVAKSSKLASTAAAAVPAAVSETPKVSKPIKKDETVTKDIKTSTDNNTSTSTSTKFTIHNHK